MENQYTFKTSEITCNGNIGGCATILTQDNMAKLRTFINEYFTAFSKQDVLKELEAKNKVDKNHIIGRRASDTDEIIYRMSSGMMSYALQMFGKNGGTYKAHRELSEMWINAQVKMMEPVDIITIMKKAIADCAEADYYYEFEKVW